MEPARSTLLARYGLPPAEIEALSLQRVDAALEKPDQWPEGEREIVRRLVYACGDLAISGLVRFHPEAVDRGVAALRAGRPIVVDVRMVETGLDRDLAAQLGCRVHCAIDAPTVIREARSLGISRAAAAMRSLADRLTDGVAIVGTAPTALLALLDLVDVGRARPAVIIGTPVGFVAAAEAKAELAGRAVPFITIEGTRGGSALAAAAANALLALAASSAELKVRSSESTVPGQPTPNVQGEG